MLGLVWMPAEIARGKWRPRVRRELGDRRLGAPGAAAAGVEPERVHDDEEDVSPGANRRLRSPPAAGGDGEKQERESSNEASARRRAWRPHAGRELTSSARSPARRSSPGSRSARAVSFLPKGGMSSLPSVTDLMRSASDLSRLPLGVGEVAGLQVLPLAVSALPSSPWHLAQYCLKSSEGCLPRLGEERHADRRDRREHEAAQNPVVLHPLLAFSRSRRTCSGSQSAP